MHAEKLPTTESLRPSLIESLPFLSSAAQELLRLEYCAPLHVSVDQSLRIKILDQCGMACTFCHNEGTPVFSDNADASAETYVSGGKSNRVSIYLGTNGANFVSDKVVPDETFHQAIDLFSDTLGLDEVHLTGGEPTLHSDLVSIVRELTEKGIAVKITSNGERFFTLAEDLKQAGLSKVVFSIFGTTPEELAAVQGSKFNNLKFGHIKLTALEKSIAAAKEYGIIAAANIVMPDSTHAERIKGVIKRYGGACKIRILNSLEGGGESYSAIYELLAELNAVPLRANMTAGTSGMSVDYALPSGLEIAFKQIRRSYLDKACDSCSLKDNGCEEGFYGVRMYMGTDKRYRFGVCIQRMDMTVPIEEFFGGELPQAILKHRVDEYNKLVYNK